MVSNWLFKFLVGQFLEPAEKWRLEVLFLFFFVFFWVFRVGQKRLPRTDRILNVRPELDWIGFFIGFLFPFNFFGFYGFELVFQVFFIGQFLETGRILEAGASLLLLVSFLTCKKSVRIDLRLI